MFQQELHNESTAHAMVRDLLRLGKESWDERQLPGELSPDVPALLRLWSEGLLIVFSMRNRQGEMVGYQLWQAGNTLFDSVTVQRVLQSIYVEPAHRGRAPAFLKYAIKTLQSRHKGALYFSIPEDAPSVMEMVKLTGATRVSQVWSWE